jgi:hypothetical protein
MPARKHRSITLTEDGQKFLNDLVRARGSSSEASVVEECIRRVWLWDPIRVLQCGYDQLYGAASQEALRMQGETSPSLFSSLDAAEGLPATGRRRRSKRDG